MANNPVLRRWRLLLGRYSERALENQFSLEKTDQKLEQTLEYLYSREYSRRGLRGGASLSQSQIHAIDWLNSTRKLFPKQVYERMQSQALERYGMLDLLEDASVVAGLEASPAMVKALIGLRGRLNATTQQAVRIIISKTVAEITQRLKPKVSNAINGRRNRFRSSALRSSQNFDWRKTINANLKNFNTQQQKLVITRPHFNSRVKQQLPWDIILCVDQSGSMTDSIIYAAVLAGILSALPAVQIKLVVFDTQIADLTALAHDPVEVLLTVQMGGGTDIGAATCYCEQLIQHPKRTIFTLISDFFEGAPPARLLHSIRRMAEAEVKLLGLAALDEDANPVYDREMAQRLANTGMRVAALTPEHFAEWLGEVIQ